MKFNLFILFFSGFVSAQTLTTDVEFLLENNEKLVKPVTLTIVDNQAFFEGDIYVGYLDESGKLIQGVESQGKGGIAPRTVVVSQPSLRWSYGVVPYKIATTFKQLGVTEAAINNAIQAISSQTGVRFVKRTNESDYIEFAPNDGANKFCYSPVGKVGGKQIVALADYCQLNTTSSVGTIIHETLHSLGFHHTHNRSDRDNYITVHLNNIHPDSRHNFNKLDLGNSINLGPYDFNSIMHYRRFTSSATFVIDVNEPMLTVISSPNTSTGGSQLSSNDIFSLKSIYGALFSPQAYLMPDFCFGGAEVAWQPVENALYYKVEHVRWSDYSVQLLLNTTNTSTRIDVSESGGIRVVACNSNNECSLPSFPTPLNYYPECM